MEEIILAMVRRESVIDVKSIVRKTGFKKENVKKALHSLAAREKLNFTLNSKAYSPLCKKCPLNRFCNRGGAKKWN
jgi:CRISPR/Cas system-associated exonuclease Cas4 (RecB family)